MKCCHVFTIVCKVREPIKNDTGFKKRKNKERKKFCPMLRIEP